MGPPAPRPPRSPQRHPLSGQDRRSMAAPAQKLPALADRLSPLPPVEPERPAGPAQPPPPRQGAAGGRQTRATLRRQPRQSDRARQRPRRPSRLRCRQENQGPQAFPARGHAGVAVGRHGGTRRLPRTKRCPHLAGGRLGRLSGTAQTVGGRRLQRPRVRRLGADATSHLDRGSRETSRRGARVYPPAQTLGRRTHLRLVDALPSPGARARANRGFRHRLDLPRHDPPHAPPTRMNITPFCLFRRRLKAAEPFLKVAVPSREAAEPQAIIAEPSAKMIAPMGKATATLRMVAVPIRQVAVPSWKAAAPMAIPPMPL